MNIQDNSRLSRIAQIAINADDVDRATAFYRECWDCRTCSAPAN